MGFGLDSLGHERGCAIVAVALLLGAGCSDPAAYGTVTLVSVGPLNGGTGGLGDPDALALGDGLESDSAPDVPGVQAQDGKTADTVTLDLLTDSEQPGDGGTAELPPLEDAPLWDGVPLDALLGDGSGPDVQSVDSADTFDDDGGPALDALPADGLSDTGPDALSDVPPDALPDMAADVGLDATTDAIPDAAPDIPPDVTPDAGPDAPACSASKPCPPGLSCKPTPTGPQCLPDCTGSVGAPEVCNGVDDDCDGQTDEATCDDANSCTADACKPALGGCLHLDQAGLPCDADGSACTLDACQASICKAGPAKSCSDGIACTVDLCNPLTGKCSSVAQEGSPCEDGNGCTGPDWCTGPKCNSGPQKLCKDGNPCTLDTCNPSSGACAGIPMGSGVACEDGTACTQGDVCSGGACSGKPVSCDDKNPCTADTCSPQSGCQHPPLNGAACDDGLACTKGESCQGGQCQNGGVVGCSDGNPCTADSCDNTGGCKHALSLGACDDGTACTQGESCATGVCAGGKNLNCDDQNPCTNDSCDAKAGCQHSSQGGACNDGNICTANDFCQGGSCVAGKPLDCNDGIACTLDACDPVGGGCLHKGQDAQCDDGFACTKDSCTPGGCAHDNIPNCCGGKNCAPGEVCIVYPDTLVPFCTAPCTTGKDCPGSCCHMAWKTKHCLPPTYDAQCCGTDEYWATEAEPYKCGKNGAGHCTEYPNPEPPYYPSKITHCDAPCTANKDCKNSCCGSTTLGTQLCVWSKAPYPSLFCPNM